MKKITSLTLVLLMCVAMLAGCGSSNDKSSDGSNPGTMPTSEAIKISDKYTFEDPADLDFDTRYVLHVGPESPMVVSGASMGLAGMYTILYAKDDIGVKEYSFTIYDSEESAQTFYDQMTSAGLKVSEPLAEDGTLTLDINDADTLATNIDIYYMEQMIPESTVSAYVDWFVKTYAAEVLE